MNRTSPPSPLPAAPVIPKEKLFTACNVGAMLCTLDVVPHSVVPHIVLASTVGPFAHTIRCSLSEGLAGVRCLSTVVDDPIALSPSELPSIEEVTVQKLTPALTQFPKLLRVNVKEMTLPDFELLGKIGNQTPIRTLDVTALLTFTDVVTATHSAHKMLLSSMLPLPTLERLCVYATLRRGVPSSFFTLTRNIVEIEFNADSCPEIYEALIGAPSHVIEVQEETERVRKDISATTRTTPGATSTPDDAVMHSTDPKTRVQDDNNNNKNNNNDDDDDDYDDNVNGDDDNERTGPPQVGMEEDVEAIDAVPVVRRYVNRDGTSGAVTAGDDEEDMHALCSIERDPWCGRQGRLFAAQKSAHLAPLWPFLTRLRMEGTAAMCFTALASRPEVTEAALSIRGPIAPFSAHDIKQAASDHVFFPALVARHTRLLNAPNNDKTHNDNHGRRENAPINNACESESEPSRRTDKASDNSRVDTDIGIGGLPAEEDANHQLSLMLDEMKQARPTDVDDIVPFPNLRRLTLESCSAPAPATSASSQPTWRRLQDIPRDFLALVTTDMMPALRELDVPCLSADRGAVFTELSPTSNTSRQRETAAYSDGLGVWSLVTVPIVRLKIGDVVMTDEEMAALAPQPESTGSSHRPDMQTSSQSETETRRSPNFANMAVPEVVCRVGVAEALQELTVYTGDEQTGGPAVWRRDPARKGAFARVVVERGRRVARRRGGPPPVVRREE